MLPVIAPHTPNLYSLGLYSDVYLNCASPVDLLPNPLTLVIEEQDAWYLNPVRISDIAQLCSQAPKLEEISLTIMSLNFSETQHFPAIRKLRVDSKFLEGDSLSDFMKGLLNLEVVDFEMRNSIGYNGFKHQIAVLWDALCTLPRNTLRELRYSHSSPLRLDLP